MQNRETVNDVEMKIWKQKKVLVVVMIRRYNDNVIR